MIHLDTSVLIDALTGQKRLAPSVRRLLDDGQRISLSALVLFEWRRGPRTTEQLEAQEALFPSDEAAAFGSAEALLASELYKKVRRARGREVDIAIAACAMRHHARLWTANPTDFADIPGLTLLRPSV